MPKGDARVPGGKTCYFMKPAHPFRSKHTNKNSVKICHFFNVTSSILPLRVQFLCSFPFWRFQRCAKYEDSTACHSSFLEFSYTVWNLTRTGLFVAMCWTVDCKAWIPPRRDFTGIVERCLALHNKTYSQLLLFAAGLPLLMNGHCLSQTVHNILCTASLLLFMVTLNGYHSRTALMTYCALCCVAMNVQSLLVAVFNIYRNLQTEKNGYMATLLYIMQLYLMFLVIMDSCTRVMSKVKNPKQDILGEDG